MQGVNKESNGWIFKYRLIIYPLVILIAGYASYSFILSEQISALIEARRENKLERSLLDSEIERLNRIEVLTASYRFYLDELAKLSNSVFKEEETLNFLRMLPQLTQSTGNTLSSLVPRDPIDPTPRSSEQAKTSVEQTKTGAQQAPTPLYKFVPVEIVIRGKYTSIARFLDSLEKLQKRLIISRIDISPESEDQTIVGASITLKLIQMDIKPPAPEEGVPIDKLASASGVQAVNYEQRQTNDAQTSAPKVGGTASKPADKVNVNTPTTVAQVQKVQPPNPQTPRPQGATSPPAVQKPVSKPNMPAKPPEEVPKLTPDFKYTVQVGAFVYKENAEKLLGMVKSQGFDGWMRQAQHSGRQMYFVYVGKYRTLKEARQTGRAMHNKIPDVRYYYLVKAIQANGTPGQIVFRVLE